VTTRRQPDSSASPSTATRDQKMRILAVIHSDRDERVVRHAADLALRCTARLTVMAVWAPTRFISFVALAGYAPERLIMHHESQITRLLWRQTSSLPHDLSLTLLCRRGVPLRGLLAEAELREYDELVLDRRLLPARHLKRLSGLSPVMRIHVVDGALASGDSRLPTPSRRVGCSVCG
jgi:hypothetical protein